MRGLALAVVIAWLTVPWADAAAKVSRVGMLWYGRPLEQRQPVIEAFRHGLSEQGHVEGQNVLNGAAAQSAVLLRADEVIQ